LSNGRGRRRKRMLSAQEKYQIWQQLLSGELSQRAAAERWGVDPTTTMRIRKVAKESALAGIEWDAPHRPGPGWLAGRVLHTPAHVSDHERDRASSGRCRKRIVCGASVWRGEPLRSVLWAVGLPRTFL
jgi:transposase-like protein